MKRTAIAVIAIAAFVAPAQALAAPMVAAPLPGARSAQAGSQTNTGGWSSSRLTVNHISDRRALNAYATYLNALINQEPVGQANDEAYIATIASASTGCKAALSPLTEPPYEVNSRAQHTLTVLGEEIGADITLNFDLAATQAFTRFASALRSLHWTRSSGAWPVIRHYVNTHTTLLSLAASNLCLDADDAVLHPDTVPENTRTFMQAYNSASNRANLALTNLMTLMQTYEMPGERGLVGRISTLANELSSQTRADLLQSGTALTMVLESAG